MDIELALPLLGGLSPKRFMTRHWQKKPLVVRGAWPQGLAGVDRAQLFEWAGSEDVECRLVTRRDGQWAMRPGPLTRRRLPPVSQREWTLLVQGVDALSDSAHELMAQFRFAPAARLDDVMVSYATDGGGVGPHFDSYDVFLLQVHGHRRWRIGRMADAALQAGLPLKILANFEPEEEHLLGPGDMLYLPPRWAHDGVAEGECITASVGFRAPARDTLAGEVLQRLLDGLDADEPGPIYRDPGQAATTAAAAVPAALSAFAAAAVARLLAEPCALACALGECLSEPKPNVFYDEPSVLRRDAVLRLDRRTRMLYDEHHLFINGESFRASGRDARLLRKLADARHLAAAEVATFSEPAWALMQNWADDGWLLSQSFDN